MGWEIKAIHRGILADERDLFNPGFLESRSFKKNLIEGARNEVAANIRDRTKSAEIVAAFADAEIGSVIGG